jgi:hypothetical protein
LPPEGKDQQAARIIMQNIARQLPLHLRGEFEPQMKGMNTDSPPFIFV